MTPKEMLDKLLDDLYYLDSFEKKKLAVIVIIRTIEYEIQNFYTMHGATERFDYWNKVKIELDKI